MRAGAALSLSFSLKYNLLCSERAVRPRVAIRTLRSYPWSRRFFVARPALARVKSCSIYFHAAIFKLRH